MTIQTSRKQIPACAKLLSTLAPNWKLVKRVLNFGAGKWPELTTEYLTEANPRLLAVTNYEPNGKKIEGVESDITAVNGQRYDLVICANVVNVCRDLDAVLTDLASVDFDCCVVQIYEGSANGKGRKTRDGYQRNELVADYMPAIQAHFPAFAVTLHRGHKCIVITKG